MTAIWNLARLEGQHYPVLHGDIEVDVAIIGGGVTGLTTAVRLLERGHKVAVLESMRVGKGNTGNSTGNLYATLSDGLRGVREKWDDETVRAIVAARNKALDAIEQRIREFRFGCQFERRSLYFCLPEREDGSLDRALDDEYEASLLAGLHAQLADQAQLSDKISQLPVAMRRALVIDGQAQYNPLRYAQDLAKLVAGRGGQIFEETAVTDVDASAGRVATAKHTVSARHIVFATHTPKGVNLLQAEMEAAREYGIAAPLTGDSQPEGTFWLLDNFHSVRTWRHAQQTWLVLIGEEHQTGHNDLGEEHYLRLEKYAREHFGVSEFPHRWSAQQYKSSDRLPYIGKSAHDNVYVATGYAADGLTWGEVAADIIAGLVDGAGTQLSELFDPRRFTPVKSAKNWATLNAKVAKHLTTDYFSLDKLQDLNQVAAGEGRVVHLHGDKLAVYRAPDNSVTVLSPVCPHLKCIVKWNGAERSWDCPCHGSRFSTDGSVIEGPAYAPLKRLEVR